MSRYLGLFAGVTGFFMASTLACAGLAEPGPLPEAPSPSFASPSPVERCSSESPQPSVPPALALDFGSSAAGDPLHEPPAPDLVRTAQSLPPVPNSAALLLCGLGTLGAWHFARSARHIHFAYIPDWFHTAGLAHVGHSVAAPDLASVHLPSYPDALILPDVPFASQARRRQERPPADYFPAPLSPRGPPLT